VLLGDLVRDRISEELYLVVERYKIHNYAGPNQWSDIVTCKSLKTGETKRLDIRVLEIVNAASR